MKIDKHITIERENLAVLKEKCERFGIKGKAWLSQLLDKLACEDFFVEDENLRRFLKMQREVLGKR